MRQPTHSRLVPLLLLLMLLFCVALGERPKAAAARANAPFQLPTRLQAGRPSDQRPWTRVRDWGIQNVFGKPPRRKHHSSQDVKAYNSDSPLNGGPPSNLLARYGGDVVLRFSIKTTAEARALVEATNVLFLDVWEFRDDWIDIRLAKDVVPSLLGLLPASLHQAHTSLMHDLAQTILDSYPMLSALDGPTPSHERHVFSPSLKSTKQPGENIFFRDYQPLSVIVPWMRLMASLFPTHVRMINIGVSYEGRDIPALRIGVHPTNSQQDSEPRKTILISGGAHAREWISVSTANYVAYSLITSYGKNPKVTKLLEQFDWVLIPTLNPDGYAYTFEVDRLWRKNRQQTSLRFCRGLDLDTSWGYQWDGESSKGNPCSESYPGEEPFQAVETHRVAEWARNETQNNNVKFVGFLDLHSYSQQVLYPYSYSCSLSPPTFENLEEVALGLAKAIRRSSGEHYGVNAACEGSATPSSGNSKRVLHPRMETGGGTALDWFYHEMQVRYTYQIKLRDTGSYGFLLPRENIIPTGEEALAAATYLGNFLSGSKGVEDVDSDSDSGLGRGKPRLQEGRREGSWASSTSSSSARQGRFRHDIPSDEETMNKVVLGEEGGSSGNDWELKRRRR
ncbi:MAG: putative metallocarboxypeptidase ecm14 [Piccolia ochrophora]|nr:MAG: putative metallocarboxypeptidase ecm14 [Piccolia ochrophora]